MALVTVTVDAWEVLEELGTEDLVRELEERAQADDKKATAALGGAALSWAVERAITALRAGDPEAALHALTDGAEGARPPTVTLKAWEDARKGEHPFLRIGGAP